MEKQKISLKIAGKSYSLRIDRDKEEAYRVAEREVNQYVASIEKANYSGFVIQDALALTALNFAILKIQSSQDRGVDEGELSELSDLETKIEEYLNRLK